MPDETELDAEDLAEQRGCTPDNDCWPDCVEAAQRSLDAGDAE